MKTRLIPQLGPETTVKVAEAFLADTLTVVNEAYWAIPILASTGTVALASQYGLWVWKQSTMNRRDVKVWLQGEGTLGDRLTRILDKAIATYGTGIALGADIPGLPYHCLANARTALLEADAVIGPTYDGGFYLLGLNRCPDGLLDDIPWSQSDTYEKTIEKLKAHNMSVVVLPYHWDIDYPEDWKALWDRKDAGKLPAGATSSIMDDLGRDYLFRDKSED